MTPLTVSKARERVQALQAKLYRAAKDQPDLRFYSLWDKVMREDVLLVAWDEVRQNKGAPGVDDQTIGEILLSGVEDFLKNLGENLRQKRYKVLPVRRVYILKADGKSKRPLGIPTIKDRVVQGALKLILEPIFEADFQDGSYGYRPGRKAHDAVDRVAKAIVQGKTTVIDLDLKSYFDNIRHHIVFEKVARRVNDDKVMHLLKLILRANGKQGVPQGGVISPLIANLYLNELDQRLERLKEETRTKIYVQIEYARFADDLVILVDGHEVWKELPGLVMKAVNEELDKVEVEINHEKTKVVDLTKGEGFSFLGFDFRRVLSKNWKWRADRKPRMKSRVKLTQKISEICRRNRSRPVKELISKMNPVLRGWVNYFRVGNSAETFWCIRHWVEWKVRRHMMRARERRGIGWNKWDSQWLYDVLGLYNDYGIRYYSENAGTQWVP